MKRVQSTNSRRRFLATAAALDATAAWVEPSSGQSKVAWREYRRSYPEGVASGDPLPDSVILWTRYPSSMGPVSKLTVEVAEDQAFERVIATTTAKALAESDWTCRVLVGHLKRSTTYWYRFTDAGEAASVARGRRR